MSEQTFPYLEWDGRVQLENSSGILINPATEETLIARSPLTHWWASLIGNAKTRWRYEWRDWGGASDEIWDLIQTWTGQTISVNWIAWGSRYLNIASWTAVGETIIQSKETFSPPFNFAFALTLSQQIANQETHIELVEVDDNGDVIIDTELFSAPNFNDARSWCGIIYDGVTTTSAKFKVRSKWISEQVWAAISFGTGFRISTGTTPNFLPTRQWIISFNADRVITSAQFINDAAVRTEAARSTNYIPDPDGKYKIRLRVKNLATVTTTDVRLHFGRIVDTTRLSVDFGQIAGSINGFDAPPVYVTNTATTATVTPPAPTTPYFLNSDATTNGALIITWTSWLQSLWATNEWATPAYIKLYNKATAPTVGTDIPEMIIPIPAAVTWFPWVANPNIGFIAFRFALWLGIAITRNAVYTDTTAIGAGEVKIKLSRTT